MTSVTFKTGSIVPMRKTALRVPFLDLKAQYASIRDEILQAVHEVLESANYVGGD